MSGSIFANRYQFSLVPMKKKHYRNLLCRKTTRLKLLFSSVREKSSSVISFTIHKHIIEKKLKKLLMHQQCVKISSHQAIVENKKNR